MLYMEEDIKRKKEKVMLSVLNQALLRDRKGKKK